MKPQPIHLGYATPGGERTCRSRFALWNIYLSPLITTGIAVSAAVAGFGVQAGHWPAGEEVLWVLQWMFGTVIVLIYVALVLGIPLVGFVLSRFSNVVFFSTYVVLLLTVAFGSYTLGRNLYL